MKARLPQGFGGGGQNMNALIKQAQQMQEKMAQYQEELAERTFEATAGGGAVSVTMTGKKELRGIKLSPDVVDPDDIEMLEDLIVAAVNEVSRQVDETTAKEMDSITGGMNIPGML